MASLKSINVVRDSLTAPVITLARSVIPSNWFEIVSYNPAVAWPRGMLNCLANSATEDKNGGGRILADLQILQHALSKWGHRRSPFCDRTYRCRGPEAPLPVAPRQRVSSHALPTDLASPASS